jgi:riboflavin kinase / FMN adenylyltransferase
MAFRVIRSLAEVPEDFGPCSLTIGNFDGVHAGHRELIRRVVAYAKRPKWRPSVLTFDPHPSKVLAPERSPHLLTSLDQRLSLMQFEQIEQVLVLPFNREIASLSAEAFVRDILVKLLGVKHVIVGDNFRFGSKQSGDTTLLRELGEKLGFRLDVVGAVVMKDRVVSSSEIRKLIGSGEITLANRMLQRPYGLEGVVVSGQGIGSKQTVPTLNLKTDAELLPASGVYVTQTWDMQSPRKWESITNVGYRPTFQGEGLTIETFLLSPFDGNSPSEIRVEFLQWIREERKFASPELLKQQILRDVTKAKAYFSRNASLR